MPQSGAELDDAFVHTRRQRADDPFHRFFVREEILTPAGFWLQPMAVQERRGRVHGGFSKASKRVRRAARTTGACPADRLHTPRQRSWLHYRCSTWGAELAG